MIQNVLSALLGAAAVLIGVVIKHRFERQAKADERAQRKVDDREEYRRDSIQQTIDALTAVFHSSKPPAAGFSKDYAAAMACNESALISARTARRARDLIDKCAEAASLKEPTEEVLALYSIELTRLHQVAIADLGAELRSSVWS